MASQAAELHMAQLRREALTKLGVKVLIFFFLFVLSSMWYYPINSERAVGFGQRIMGGPVLNIVFAAHLLFVVLFLPTLRHVNHSNKWLVAIVLTFTLSAIWSIDSAISFKEGFRLILIFLTFTIVASIFTYREVLIMLFQFFAVAVVLNVLFIGAMPGLGMMGGIHSGALRGLFAHKNQFGYFLVLAIAVFGYFSVSKSYPHLKMYAVILLLLSSALMFLSRSSGSLVAFFAVFFMMTVGFLSKILLIKNQRGAGLLMLAILAIALSPVAYQLYAMALGLLGKDPTLTNRTDIWAVYIRYVEMRPILGWGANTFFTEVASTQAFLNELGSTYQLSAHNGYLATALGTGFVGLILYLGWCFSSIHYNLRRALIGFGGCQVFAMFFVTQMVRGIGETNGSVRPDHAFALMVLVSACVSMNFDRTERMGVKQLKG